MLRNLKVPRDYLRQPDQSVKLRLLYSILTSAANRGVPEDAFFEMGVDAFKIPENEKVRRRLSMLRTPQEIYEWFFDEAIVQFESNFDYRIRKSTSDSIILELEPKEGRVEENGLDVTSNRLLSIYRWGIAAGLIRWIGCPVARARPVAFASSDRRTEQFELSWTTPTYDAFRMRSAAAGESQSKVPSLRLV